MMDRKEAIGLCLCGMCPSFVDCKEELAYCLAPTGASKCIKLEQGCLCPGCTVLETEGLQHVYYCIRGSESDQLAAK
jgi:Protein of unknown function (DUF2769)